MEALLQPAEFMIVSKGAPIWSALDDAAALVLPAANLLMSRPAASSADFTHLLMVLSVASLNGFLHVMKI